MLILPGDQSSGMLETLLCRTFANTAVDPVVSMTSSSALKRRGCVFGIRTRPARVPFSRLGRVHRYPWGRRQRKAIGGISITTYSVAFASSCHPWRRTAPGWRIRADPARRAPGQGRRAGWPGAVARPRLPRIRTCPIRTSDSSGCGFAAKRRASRLPRWLEPSSRGGVAPGYTPSTSRCTRCARSGGSFAVWGARWRAARWLGGYADGAARRGAGGLKTARAGSPSTRPTGRMTCCYPGQTTCC